ncbi:MAG: cell division protein FtsA [Endomicrobiia bacterium]|nr:cell division protein FtsA [Endomicrobiia bacterium]
MAKQDIVGSVDLGSSHVICVVGRPTDAGAIEVLGVGRVETRGIKNGVVMDVREASAAVKAAVEAAEEASDQVLRRLYVALRGAHLESHNSRGTLAISRTDKEITEEDVEHVIENAKMNVRLSADREIIHSIPQSFTVNSQTGISNPVGMDGTHLEADIHVVTASSDHLNNIQKAIAKAGFEVIEFIHGILSLGELVVTQEEKDLGCMLVDIGGLSTGLVLYQNGVIRSSSEIEIGSDNITKDLAHFLKTNSKTAAEIKEKYGTAMKKLMKTDEASQKIAYTGIDGKTTREVKRAEIIPPIESRLDQIVTFLSDAGNKIGYSQDLFAGGAVLSGGGSRLSHIDEAFMEWLKLSARIAAACDVNGPSEILNNPTYHTAISLLKYHFGDARPSSPRRGSKQGMFQSLTKWWNDAF